MEVPSEYMFYHASSFDQDISGWDVSNGTDLSSMLRGTTSFNQPNIEIWTPPNDANFSYMFRDAHADMIARFGTTPTIDHFHKLCFHEQSRVTSLP